MLRRYREEKPARNVSPLISMLVRYPEIGTVKYDPRQQTIRFTLLLVGPLDDEEFSRLRRLVTDTLEVYHLMDQRQTAVLDVSRETYGELISLAISRDVVSLTPAEIWTIMELLRERYEGRLMAEPSEFMGEDEMMAQDEMIEQLLSELEGGRTGRDLIAIREDGRVMVFQK